MVLREIEGLAYEEIADLLHVNLGTVKSRLMRGRAALRAVLVPAGSISLSGERATASHRASHSLPPGSGPVPFPMPHLDHEPCILDSELEVSR